MRFALLLVLLIALVASAYSTGFSHGKIEGILFTIETIQHETNPER